MKVAVTAVGGGVGQSIIKALSKTKYKTIGIDPSAEAAGLYMADKGFIGKNCDEPGYIERLLTICQTNKCKYIFPGLDKELKILSDNFLRFKKIGTTPIVSDAATIELSDDKYKLYEFLKEKGFPYIKSARTLKEADEMGVEYPLLIKPLLGGARSQGVMICRDFKQADAYIESIGDNYIIQEYIDGNEYTCGSVTFNSDVKGTIIMRRILRDGDTYKAFVEKNDNIDSFLRRLLPEVSPFGPCNVQLRLRDNIPYVLEINARCSGTTGARALAGFNEPEMVLNFLEGKDVAYNVSNISILRYWNEYVVENSEIEELKHEGSTDRSKRRSR